MRYNEEAELARRVQRSYEAEGGTGRRARTVDILVGCFGMAPTLWGKVCFFSSPRCTMNASAREQWLDETKLAKKQLVGIVKI